MSSRETDDGDGDGPIFVRELETDSRGRVHLDTELADLDVRICHSRPRSVDDEGRVYLGRPLANQTVRVALEDVDGLSPEEIEELTDE